MLAISTDAAEPSVTHLARVLRIFSQLICFSICL